jgi:hypothetical protein
MLIHRAMTNGTDRMTPGPSASAARNSARITSSNSRLSPESSQFEANVDTYTVAACPCRVRPLWQFLRCDMPYWDRPSHPPSPKYKTKSGQPAGCPGRHMGIRIAPCDRIRRRKTIKGIRPRVLPDCPCGGDQHECAQGQAQAAASEQYWSQVPPASHSPMPWRSFRPAGSPAFTIAASSLTVAIVFLAGSWPDHHLPQLRH